MATGTVIRSRLGLSRTSAPDPDVYSRSADDRFPLGEYYSITKNDCLDARTPVGRAVTPIVWGFMTISFNLSGILAMVAAMGLFIGSDSCMQIAMSHLPLFQLELMRGLSSILPCLSLLIVLGLSRNLVGMFNLWLVARGLCEVVANFGFTPAIFHMAIADVRAIAKTRPLLVLMGAILIWGERLGPSRLLLIVLGIAGALLAAQPGTTAASPYAIPVL